MTIPWRFVAMASLAWASMGLAHEPFYQSEAGDVLKTNEDAEEFVVLSTISDERTHDGIDDSKLPENHFMQEATVAYPGTHNESKALLEEDENQQVPVEEVPGPSGSVAINGDLKGSAALAETHSLKGIKSLLAGSIILGLALFAVGTSVRASEIKPNSLCRTAATCILSGVVFVQEFMEERLPRLELAVPVLFIGAGPALIFSGLVGFVASLRARRGGGGNSLWLRGLLLVILGSLILASVSFPEADDDDDDYVINFDVWTEFAAHGLNVVGFFVLLTSFGQWLFSNANKNRTLGKPATVPLPILQDTSYAHEQAEN